MKRVLMVVMVAGATVGAAYAQGGPGGPAERHGRGGFADRLGLSQEQRAEMEKVQVTFRKEQIRQRAELQVARLELAELLAASTIDDKAVLAKAQTVSQLEAAQVKRRIEHRLAMAKVLTPEQRQRARELGLGRHWRGGKEHEGSFDGRGRHFREGWGERGSHGPGGGGAGRGPALDPELD
jgi:Spy/CpxP family protein refolding chaperone